MSGKWRLRSILIKQRLLYSFGALLVLMLAGCLLSLYQFRNVSRHIERITEAERRLSAVLRLNAAAVTLMSQLSRAARNHEADVFELNANRALNDMKPQIDAAKVDLHEIGSKNDQYALMTGSIQSMLDSLPARVAVLIELARAGDWAVLDARLRNQSDRTDEVFAVLVRQADQDLSADRKALLEDSKLAQRRGVTLLAVAGIVGLSVAIALGTAVTYSITRPLEDLDAGARALAAGRFDHRVPVTGADELTRLADVFNQSAADLARVFGELESARATAESAQAALQTRNEELARANADLQQFAYSASHDLREPLRTLAVYTELLQREQPKSLDPTVQEYLSYIFHGAQHMDRLLSDLLAYTQTTTGQSAETLVDAAAVLQQVQALFSAELASTGAKILAGPLPQLRIREVHLQQLFQNLIGNALKYRSTRPPVIEIAADLRSSGWELSVKDNGIGIDAKYVRHIFGIFKRLHGNRYPGTGIGLAICQRIVEGYGGKIWVESTPGEGSTFRFTLPG